MKKLSSRGVNAMLSSMFVKDRSEEHTSELQSDVCSSDLSLTNIDESIA